MKFAFSIVFLILLLLFFFFNLNDPEGQKPIATVNEAPHAVDDSFQAIQSSVYELDVLKNDFDPEQEVIELVFVSQPEQGRTSIKNNKLLFFPSPTDFKGEVVFQYTISDSALEDSAQVILTIN